MTCVCCALMNAGHSATLYYKLSPQRLGSVCSFCAQFRIVHYAGTVTYTVDGFMDKNNDLLFRDIKECMGASSNTIVATCTVGHTRCRPLRALWSSHVFTLLHICLLIHDNPRGHHKSAPCVVQQLTKPCVVYFGGVASGFPSSELASKKRPVTAGTQFKQSLNALIDILMQKTPSYVRCIKPNATKTTKKFDQQLVEHQVGPGGACVLSVQWVCSYWKRCVWGVWGVWVCIGCVRIVNVGCGIFYAHIAASTDLL